MESNPLSKALLNKKLSHPKILLHPEKLSFKELDPHPTPEDIRSLFPETSNKPHLQLAVSDKRAEKPKRVGVVFSGGQAPGGHNVIWGLEDTLKRVHKDSKLFGFIGGPKGFLERKYKELTQESILPFHNLGGFNMIGSGRDKIESDEDLKKALESAKEFDLDGFVIIGGDDSNTNAAILSEYFKKNGCKTSVVGVPKTIDGDLQNEYIDISFGFDTACKLYSELVGNILTDVVSSMKYYHFIKLMGRSASHVTLEVGLQTQPNLVLIGEEIKKNETTLDEIVERIAKVITKRSEQEKNYGVILIPEGLINFIPDFSSLNQEINAHLVKDPSLSHETILPHLSETAKAFFQKLPESIQEQLLLDRDSHGNTQLAKIDTQDLLIEMTEAKLKEKKVKFKFNPLSHYFGYEGRSSNPSSFDAEYTYALGQCAALLIEEEHSGYMACIRGLKKKAEEWELYGVPITSLLTLEVRLGNKKPVIKKALVDLESDIFKHFKKVRKEWLLEDKYNAPGPIQYFGDDSLCNIRNFTLEFS